MRAFVFAALIGALSSTATANDQLCLVNWSSYDIKITRDAIDGDSDLQLESVVSAVDSFGEWETNCLDVKPNPKPESESFFEKLLGPILEIAFGVFTDDPALIEEGVDQAVVDSVVEAYGDFDPKNPTYPPGMDELMIVQFYITRVVPDTDASRAAYMASQAAQFASTDEQPMLPPGTKNTIQSRALFTSKLSADTWTMAAIDSTYRPLPASSSFDSDSSIIFQLYSHSDDTWAAAILPNTDPDATGVGYMFNLSNKAYGIRIKNENGKVDNVCSPELSLCFQFYVDDESNNANLMFYDPTNFPQIP